MRRELLKQYIIQNWLINRNQPGGDSIIRNQLQQTWARFGFALAGLAYLYTHAVLFDVYAPIFLPVVAAYFLYNALSLAAIKRRPLSAFRMLFSPLFDVFVVSFGILMDGGQTSGLYLVLYVIIFGNGFRFGNALLLYTQALSFLGLTAVSIITLTHMHIQLDKTLLFWQLAGLLAIPLYVYLIGEKAENALRAQDEAERASFSLLDQGPLPVFTYDFDDHDMPRILYANAAMTTVYRDSHTHLIGEQVDILALMEDGDEMLNCCRNALQTPKHEPHRFYIRGRDKYDEILQLMCQVSRLRWRGQWIGVCFMLDITQREKLLTQMDQARKQGYMSTLVAGIVHDFRNVLTNMMGNAEIVQFGTKNKTTKEQLGLIIEAGERGSEMITHLLSLGKSGDPTKRLDYISDLKESLESIIGLARLQLPAHIQLHCSITEPLPRIRIDITEVEQILLNLIHNASHAITETGHIRINIKADNQHELAAESESTLCVQICDDGEGIADENIDKIFKPFWTSRSAQGGSGLGLAMVQRIVRNHHGSLDVESKLGEGTCITIHFPPDQVAVAARPAPQPSAGGTHSKQKTLAKPKPCRILLVDDSPEVLHVHTALLSRMKHDIVTAENGQQALEIFSKKDEHFDMLITDFRMPKMDGLELVASVRDMNNDIIIIMITAYGEEERLQEVGKYQVELMNKPVTLSKLTECIARLQSARKPAA